MGAIFSGLCQVGAWGCFDEFNRISIEVLSVVSAQVKAIQNALNYKKFVADIGFGEIRVDAKVGAFITMNPGYAGRTELPDNLKALFRPVTMIVPDLLQICEIMLFSEGFEGARILAKKMTTLYKLSKEQLSRQFHYGAGQRAALPRGGRSRSRLPRRRRRGRRAPHPRRFPPAPGAPPLPPPFPAPAADFGLRALKSVLVMAGGLKREFAEMSEDVVLMRSLRDNNLPKFVYEDVPLFSGLIADLFPGLDCPRVAYPQLKSAIEAEFDRVEMHHDDEAVYQTQVDKVIQLYEIILTRHTTMIVGPTGGGKTVCINTLQKASLPAFGKTIKTFTLNPKAQTVNELYGVMDPATRDWYDGVLSKLFRTCNEPLPPGKEDEVRWIVFDGDVDAVWVENMNSVMDDNKLLTLPNGERIRLQSHCKLVIEVFDLQYASPATISRCGMTFMDPKNLGFRPYYVRWVKQRCLPAAAGAKQKPTEAGHLQDLFDKYVPKLIAYVLEGDNGKRDPATGAQAADAIEEPLAQVLPQSNLNLTKQLCAMLDATLPSGDTEVEDSEVAEGLFLFALVWSIGAAVTVAHRERFNTFLTAVSEGAALAKGSLYESFYDVEGHRWEEWKARVPAYEPPAPFDFSRILVPTTDSVLYTYLLSRLTAIEKPVLLVGESGTAKTVTIQNYLGRLEPEKFSVLNINFSSRTTSKDVQTNIEANVDKRSGKTYGPPVGKKLVVFIDDMNMPRVDKYGTQQPIALLLFLVSRGNMYDRGKELDLRTYKDLMFMGAMGPPGGGRNSVDPRFVALFSVFNLTPPTTDVLTKIYGSILTRFMEPFSDDVRAAAAKITGATLALYASIIERLPPTPSKFHYIFNLRDLGRVYEGLCLSTPTTVTTGPALIRQWRNEVMRIFGDRLISPGDAALVNGLFAEVVKKSFPDAVDAAMADPCLYGDFALAAERVANDKEDPRRYQDLGTYADIRVILDKVLETHNTERKPMTLVLFEMALEHMTRLLRIIKVPRGNALLVGVGGSGKQSLTRLSAFTAGYKLFEVTLVRNYGEAEFREDLKSLYKLLMAGPVVFLFTDAHVLEEGFLELINNMLTTGMVPALYEKDEIDGIVNQVRKEVKEAGLVDTKENCWSYFVTKARNNLHLVLAMSPSGDTLRRRCRNFPGLVSNTVIDWFFAWPEDALERVAEFFLREESLPDDKRGEIVRHMVHVHTSVVTASKRFEAELRRHNYVTPKNYLDFIANYRSQLTSQRGKISTRVRRLEGGLTKLTEASTAVDIMSVELREQKIVVDAKTKDVQALIKDIGERQAIADRQQADAKAKSEELAKAAVVIADESAKANKALEAALPALEAAAQALDNLNKDDITEIKAFASPPALVMMVCMCIMALRPTGKENESEGWKGAKSMISDSNFLKALKTYDKDKINDRMIKKVLAYFKEPDFTMEKMKTVSRAGAGLLQWVVAIKEYYGVARDVDPLRKKVADMERAQAQGERELEEITALVAKLSAELADLDVKYKAASSELNDLTTRAALMEKRLSAASKLVSGLGSESSRWTADVQRLNGQYTRLVGDCALAASFLSYLGPFTFDYRVQLLDGDWSRDVKDRGIPVTEPFSVEDLLITEATVQKWSAEGLPADTHSVYNGILTTRCSRFPLCIDPQQQAVGWLKTREKELKVATFLDGDFMQPLKLAIQYGKPFLFEGVDETIDPMIDPILEQNTFMDGSQKMITLDDKAIPWDDNFRLYMTSKLANPHYSPEVMGKLQIINYSVTLGGLENQLLNVVVGHERPDLEKQFADLVADMGANATLLEELEESLLRNLASSTGNILDNEELIATLDSAKSKSVEISAKLSQAAVTKADINRTRAGYAPAAKRGSILFFAIAGLSNINPMYETSLASFLVVFRRALSSAKKAGNLELRLKNMVASMTLELYGYTCTGIFERHKLMFSFQMTCMIQDGEGQLNRAELDFFLKGDTALEAPKDAKPYPWLSPAGWKDLLRLGQGLGSAPGAAAGGEEKKDGGNVFADLVADVKGNGAAWRAWYDLEQPEMDPLPSGLSDRLSLFQLLLVMRCFRPDRVYNAVKRFVMGAMGEQFVQPPVLDYSRIFAQMTPSTPAVFILSPGADPQSDIQTLGTQLGFPPPTKFKFLALGQGQAGKAEELLEQGATRGYWILLQNTHLLISWLKNLEKILASMAKPHQDFRLWMTTDPTDRFPLGILQRSLKVVTEPPDGLKLNMRSVYAKLQADPETATGDECPHPAYKPLVYVLTFTHAVLLERRKFGKIGFNVAYDFNESDFQISRRLLSLYLSKAHANGDEVIPWGSLRYLVGEAMYGGRVSDAFDRRILTTYLDEFMGDFLFDSRNKFYFARSGFDYELPALPANAGVAGFAGSVEVLPLTNGPAVFGLHPNAEISYFSAATKALWENLIDLQPRSGGVGGGVSREDYIAAIVRDVQSKLPPLADVFNIRKRFSEGGAFPSPTQIVLLQELERFNKLVETMASSLTDVARALAGEIGMSDVLEDVASALFNAKLPTMWRSLTPDTQKPLGSWMSHFSSRHAQYTAWVESGDPKVMWLSGLHVPESYLTALVQTTCRRKGWALDRSTLYTRVTSYIKDDDVPGPPEDGCYIRGLYLEGAGWDVGRGCLRRSDPKVLVVDLPILQMVPIEATRLKLAGTFRTPVYVTQMRRNAMGVGLVFEADLTTQEHPSHWVLQGVALSLNTDN
jgi:dynein heavy chain